jgi:hypothetical protein
VTVLAIADPTTIGAVLALGVAMLVAAAWFIVFVVRNLNAIPKRKG